MNKATLSQNYLNPFSGSTVVQYSVQEQSATTKIVVTNVKGQQLQSLVVEKDMQQ